MMRAYFFLVALTACSTDTFTTPDASTDASTDVITGGEAGGGDGGGGPCSQPSFCASQSATTCDDFETPSKWLADPTNAVNITVGTTQTTSTSCPNALQVVMPSMPAPIGTEPHGYMLVQLNNPGNVTVDLDALLPTIGQSDAGNVDGVVVFALRGTVDATWAVRLERSGDGAWFIRLRQGASSNVPSAPVPNILMGAWNHLQLNVHYATDTSGSVSLTYTTAGNANQAVKIPSVQTLPNTGVQESASFVVGAGAFAAITRSYTFLYDSITIDAN
jgi:hypothetical protein